MNNILKAFSALLIFAFTPCSVAEHLPLKNAVVSAHSLATRAGLTILKKGGNAFDAAIAVASTLAVVEPYHSGIGGGGFFLIRDAKHHRDTIIDAREIAPLAASKNMYLKNGKVMPMASLNGPLSAAIPGEVAGLVYLSKHYATLSLQQDLAPAIKYARSGFKVDRMYRKRMKNYKRLTLLRLYPSSAKIFLRKNKIPYLGYRIKQKDLSDTLSIIAKKGNAGFYQGLVANALVTGVRANGGIWSKQDLLNYKIKVRKPLIGTYKHYKITTMPPPSAGGIAIITMLNVLSHYPIFQESSVMRTHHIIEAMRVAYWDRARYLGDPDFVRIPLSAILSSGHANELIAKLNKNKATPSKTLEPVAVFNDSSPNTTHFSVIDKQGNIVNATLTINYYFGSGFVVPGTGVLLNDEMDDFAIKPGQPNIFGLIGHPANAIQPGKRPLSSMSPTFVESKNKIAILGTPGGSRIPTMVLLAILDFIKGSPPQSWVSLKRFHHQYLPDSVYYEKNTFNKKQINALNNLGHRTQKVKLPFGNMQVLLWNFNSGKISGASDPRGIGKVSKNG